MTKFKLEKRGCDINPNADIVTDLTNYRTGIYSYTVPGKDGKLYLLEFTHGAHWKVRKTNKRTGAPLKHPVTEIIIRDGLFVNTAFETIETGRNGETWVNCYRASVLERELWDMHLPFTIAGIETALEYITGEKYIFDGYTE